MRDQSCSLIAVLCSMKCSSTTSMEGRSAHTSFSTEIERQHAVNPKREHREKSIHFTERHSHSLVCVAFVELCDAVD